MSTKHGVYDVAEFKALPDVDGQKGRFEALVSVFGNVDLQGDRVMPGAFTATLDEWKATGAPIPIIWSHDWGNPNAHIGSATPDQVTETEQGLKVGGSIDLDNPFAAQVYRLLKERRVKEFSFGYNVRKEKKADDGANDLLDLGLIEVGPTLKGANPSTELLAVKSDLEVAAKAGRPISAKNGEKLRTATDVLSEATKKAVELINEVLGSPGEPEDNTDEDKARADDPKAVVPQSRIELDARIRSFPER